VSESQAHHAIAPLGPASSEAAAAPAPELPQTESPVEVPAAPAPPVMKSARAEALREQRLRGRPEEKNGRRIDRDRDRERERERAALPPDSPIQEIPLEQIDPHALEVIRRLRRFGYRAYLVGGCVRDLFLGLKPKDFDVATSARPEEVKAIFRNSRIIGRRFRLVHVFFRGGKIIETSTFRANAAVPEEEGEEAQDLLIRRDNVFGTEEEDARRRDFTINGLFYDIGTGRIIDHVGGLDDLRARTLKMIGDPEIRLREDPVRILRAIRIAAKVNFTIDTELARAMTRHKADISRCAPARVLEETLRLLRIGHAEKTVRMMEETGVLEFLLPELFSYLEWPREREPVTPIDGRPIKDRLLPEATSRDLMYRHLGALDRAIEKNAVSDAVVVGALLYAPVIDIQFEAEREGRDKARAVNEFLVTVGARLTLTRRLAEHLRQIFTAQRHFVRVDDHRKKRRAVSPAMLARRAFFADAFELFAVHAGAVGIPQEQVEHWRPRAPLPEQVQDDDVVEDEREAERARRRRRRRGGRGRRRASPTP
jgi:poly(A) polymerase